MYRLVNLTCTAFICLAQIIYPQTSSTILLSQTPTLYGPPGSRTIDLYVNEKDPSIIYASNYEGGLFKNSVAIRAMQNFAHIINIFFSKTTEKLFFMRTTVLYLVVQVNETGS